MSKKTAALKAIFSTANFNGMGAALMSLDVGSALGTALYFAAVSAGTYNKYHSLTQGGDSRKSPALKFATHPAITAAAFMLAAGYNFGVSAYNLYTQPGDHVAYNLLCMGGWIAGFLGDNALRRLDSVNFKPKAHELGASMKSKISKTFNALVANPTIFYGLTSTGFVLAGLTTRTDAAGNHLPMFSGTEGMLGAATASLVAFGIAYAVRNSWRAVHGKIPTEQINDGVMNYMSFAAKLGYGALAFANGEYGLAGAHLIFAASSVKVIYETRSALSRKKGPGLPDPAAAFI
jgi:hypothetical protein